MNHQIYGVILFAFILILIYLLNHINSNYNINEGFENENTEAPRDLNDFNVYDNVYFGVDKEIPNISFENALSKCMNDSQCLGITRYKNKDSFYTVNNLDFCKTQYQGSDLEKNDSKNYITYIKKTVGSNRLSCISDDTMNKIISIQGGNSNVWIVKNNKIELSPIARVDDNNEFNLTKFKLVKGLSGKNTVSIKFEINGFPDTYVVNEYPKKAYLSVREINDNQKDLKNSASFKIVNGLVKSGFSIKIVGFPNMFISGVSIGENKKIIGVSMVESSDNESIENATFYIKSELSKDYIRLNDLESTTPKDNNDIVDFSSQEKIKKMRSKNVYTLEKQANLLESQTNMINNYDFIHKNNISSISREFANQSANLALSKYLEDKNDMDNINNNTKSKMIDNIPSNRRI